MVGIGFGSVSRFLVDDNVEEIVKERTVPNLDLSTVGGARRAECDGRDDWRQNLESKIRKQGNRITSLAAAIGIGNDALTAELREQSIKVPLSNRTINRLGRMNLDTIRADLRAGKAKTQIMKVRNVSEWTLRLIELDEPGIAKAHKIAASDQIRESQREKVLLFLERNPGATRSTISQRLSGSYDFFRSKDRTWFEANVKSAKRHTAISRPLRLDWDLWDRSTARAIRQAAAVELGSSRTPRRLTTTSLLRSAGALSRYGKAPRTLPLTEAALRDHVESKEQFVTRKIFWGVKEMARDGKEISVNLLRRKVGLPAKHLRAYRDQVICAIHTWGATPAGRSFFKSGSQSTRPTSSS
jgi:hypothetical protein